VRGKEWERGGRGLFTGTIPGIFPNRLKGNTKKLRIIGNTAEISNYISRTLVSTRDTCAVHGTCGTQFLLSQKCNHDKCKGKVVPVLFLTEHHATKAYWG
jgi:hypothetical protein